MMNLTKEQLMEAQQDAKYLQEVLTFNRMDKEFLEKHDEFLKKNNIVEGDISSHYKFNWAEYEETIPYVGTPYGHPLDKIYERKRKTRQSRA